MLRAFILLPAPKARWAVKVRISLGAQRAPLEDRHEEGLVGHGPSLLHGLAAPIPDGTGRIEDHFPGKICNLSGSQTSFHGEQNDHVVSKRIPSRFGKQEEVVDLVRG